MIMNNPIQNLSRRGFLQGAAGLTLGLSLPAFAAKAGAVAAQAAVTPFEPTPFLRIGADNSVTVLSKHLEMGQGTYTGLATIVAEELDAAWVQVKVEGAPADAKRFNNLAFGPMQGTFGSTAMANSWDQLRQTGATARAMLVSAAAKRWNVPAAEIAVRDGVLSHAASKRKATFGELAEAAAAEAVPASVSLKDPKDFRLIGKHAPRKDSFAKTNGSAQFTQDVHLPGMLVAVVAHSPRFGGKLKSFDARKAKAIKGVVDVVAIPTGVAVLATDTWTAKKGRDALSVEWDDSAAFKLGTGEMQTLYHALAQNPGLVARKDGDAPAVLAAAGTRTIKASYDFPYLAHAAMEPMNCVIQRTADGLEVWNGEQFQTVDQGALAAMFGLPADKVTSTCCMPVAASAGGPVPRWTTSARPASIVKVSGHRGAGQAGVDARGRHQGRLLPAHVPPHPRSHPGCGRQHPGLASPPGGAVHRQGLALRGLHDQGRRGWPVGGGGRQPALCHPQPAGRTAHPGRHPGAGAVVAFGGLDPHRLFHRDLPRPSGR
jgi:isoquinoline 1-oxidoreductase beta subunit